MVRVRSDYTAKVIIKSRKIDDHPTVHVPSKERWGVCLILFLQPLSSRQHSARVLFQLSQGLIEAPMIIDQTRDPWPRLPTLPTPVELCRTLP